MAMDNKVVVNWISGNLTGTINIPGTEFEEKETYTLKITISDTAGNEAIYTFDVVNALEHYPALCVYGAESGMGETGWTFYTEGLGPCVLPYIGLRNITSNITFTLRSSEGDTDRYNVIEVGDSIKSLMIQRDLGASYINVSTGVNIEADFPLFMGTHSTYSDANLEGDLYDYEAEIQGTLLSEIALAGDYTNIGEAINVYSEEDTIPKNQDYYIENRLKKNGSIIETKLHRFQIPPGAKIWLVAPAHDPNGQTYNMTLNMTGTNLTFRYKIGSSSWQVGHLLTPTLRKYYYGTWTDYNNGDLYVTINATNIPIFASETAGDMYMAGELDESDAINAGELQHQKPTTGSDLESTDVPNISVSASGVGCNVWALSSSQIKNVMGVLFDDDQTVIDDIKNGTWLWGNNPADFIISMYYVPFDVSNFYNVSNHQLYLGFHDTGFEYPRVSETKTSGQRITLCTTTIDPVYGDWRDYTNFKYEIYLPFVGFFPLDVMSYLNKRLTVELAFDIMTHNIRYYLFANDKLIDRVDGSVGYDIPLLATDQVNKAKSDIAGVQNLITGGASVVGAATGLPGASVSEGIGSILSGIQNVASYPKVDVVGGISSCMNIYDINYCYLKITEKDTLKPSRLNSMYNWPSYYIGNVSILSGYTEIENIRFGCSGTEEEIEEIQTLMKNGVIL